MRTAAAVNSHVDEPSTMVGCVQIKNIPNRDFIVCNQGQKKEVPSFPEERFKVPQNKTTHSIGGWRAAIESRDFHSRFGIFPENSVLFVILLSRRIVVKKQRLHGDRFT